MSQASAKSSGLLARYQAIPLYLKILVGLILGLVVGVVYGPAAAPLDLPAKLILRLLGALAPPIVLLAVIHALLKAEVEGKTGWRLGKLLTINTLTAILVGLTVANVLKPGSGGALAAPTAGAEVPKGDVFAQLMDNLPDSMLRPLVDNKVIGVVLVAIAIGVAGRKQIGSARRFLEDGVSVAFDVVIVILHWIIALVPLAVFGKVASIVGKSGFAAFSALGAFVLAVLVALLIQSIYYLVRIRLGSWARPMHVLRGVRDALVMAFSTASSTATMPVTYECLVHKVGVRQRSASLGALVGANFNNDGTALYEAMSALFIAQMLGHHLSLTDQLLIIITSVIASVGAAGIPEAGLVTMTLVFTAVRLPTEYIALLLTVDWFLDRCRTAINVLGDVNISCLLDGKEQEVRDGGPEPAAAPS